MEANKRRALSPDLKSALSKAIETNHPEAIKSILLRSNKAVIWNDVGGIYNIDSIEMARTLLPIILDDEPRSRIPVCWLIRAAKNGCASMVEFMLSVDQAFIRNEHHLALSQAASYGQTDIVHKLLGDDRFDAGWAKNDALACAAMNGHLDCVHLLLAHKDVCASDCSDRALAYAADGGHEEVVAVLLQQENVDPKTMNSRAIRWAARNGHFGVLRKLLFVR